MLACKLLSPRNGAVSFIAGVKVRLAVLMNRYTQRREGK